MIERSSATNLSVISCAASLNRKAILRGQSFNHSIIQSFSHRARRQSRLIGVQLLHRFFTHLIHPGYSVPHLERSFMIERSSAVNPSFLVTPSIPHSFNPSFLVPSVRCLEGDGAAGSAQHRANSEPGRDRPARQGRARLKKHANFALSVQPCAAHPRPC